MNINGRDVNFLWALEKNVKAIAFYERHGFHMTMEKKFEEGTTEYLVRLQMGSGFSPLNKNSDINEDKIEIDGNTLTYTSVNCRVQRARERKGMPFHPCKSVGIIEYSEFAKVIDERFVCECVSCYPDITDSSCCCKWKFTIV